MPPPTLLVHLALLLVSLLFGVNYVFTKELLAVVSPRAWVFLRIAAATVLLLPLALRFRRGRLPRDRWLPLLLAALLGVVLNQILFTEGIARTTPAHSAVINACIPTWTLALAALVGQERLTAGKVAAVLIALLGVGTLLRADALLSGDAPISPQMLLGDLLTLGNGLSFAGHLVLMRRIGRDLDPWLVTAAMFLMATTMISVYGAPALSTATLREVSAPPAVYYALYAVLFSTVLTYLLNTWALRHCRSSQVALYINVQPLVAAALGIAYGQGLPDWRFFVALGGVATALVLQSRAG